MANFILDAQLHFLACHLLKVDHRVDLKKEIRYLNNRYGFVPEAQYSGFEQDVYALYEFEKNRQTTKRLNTLGYAKFKVDRLTGNATLESHDAALDVQLSYGQA